MPACSVPAAAGATPETPSPAIPDASAAALPTPGEATPSAIAARTAPPPATTADALLRLAATRLGAAGVEQPVREARLLLRLALGLDAAGLLGRDRAAPVPAPALATFEALLARRAAREPMALLTGRQGFWTLDLAVSRATLLPRADSETLVEAALARFPGGCARVLDLGTGSGCLLLAVLAAWPGAWGVGLDLAPDAAALAAGNAATLGLAGRSAFLAGHWAAPLAGRFDLVLCNPPYIRSDELPGLMPEVRLHEPARALDGGTDGLDAHRAVLGALPDLLTPGGCAILELGLGQAPAVTALALAAGLRPNGTRRDLGGIERAIMLAPG